MRLLICTQVVDRTDSNLGFFVEWIREFAGQCESVEVITLREGQYMLPANVRVHGFGARSRIGRAWEFWQLLWRLRHAYDCVFVHMNPEYIVLGGLFWRFSHKKVALWYAHKSVTIRLRIATLLADDIFTVAPGSFRIDTPKKRVVGHGIDMARFIPKMRTRGSVIRLITVGRISASKHLLEMLHVLDILAAHAHRFSLEIIGAPLTDLDQDYFVRLKTMIAVRPYANDVQLTGAIDHDALAAHLANADVALNFATTGNMDKAGLEALAAGVPLVTTNHAFAALHSAEGVFLVADDPQTIAAVIDQAAGANASQASAVVNRDHSLEALIPKIIYLLSAP